MTNGSLSRRHLLLSAASLALTLAAAAAAFAQAPDFPNKKEPLPGITTAGQPSADQLAGASKAGYKLVIDLRTSKEDHGMNEKAVVEKLGMQYVQLPVDGAAGLTYENAAALDKLLSQTKEPVLLHCASGNRAGALLALRAKLTGADNDAALALGVAGGVTGLKGAVAQKLAQGHD